MLSISLVKRFARFAPGVALTLLLVGCGPSPAESLNGIYTTLISASDPQANGVSPAGRWDLALGDDNRFTVLRDGEVVVEGQYVVKEDQLEFTNEKGPLACLTGQASGIYGWSLDGKTLTLTLIEDVCEGRKAVLAAHPFSRLAQ